MEWSNEKALEFLELFQTEPCLWDPRQKNYKNRGCQNDAWQRIKQGLRFTASVEDLKKKKESLMGYYRNHLNKYKKSFKSGASRDQIYTTNWFAFQLMDSFLRPIYESSTRLNTVGTASDTMVSEAFGVQETDIHGDDCIPSTSHDQNSLGQAMKRPSISEFNSPSTGQQRFVKKKVPPELITAKKHMDEAFDYMKSVATETKKKDLDEYDHFALMIAAKIRKLNDSFQRESLMNTIHNLVFQSIAENGTVLSCSSSQSQLSNITERNSISYLSAPESITSPSEIMSPPETILTPYILVEGESLNGTEEILLSTEETVDTATSQTSERPNCLVSPIQLSD